MLKYYLNRIINLPPHIVAQRVVSKIKRAAHNRYERSRDLKRSTYSFHTPQERLHSYLRKLDFDQLLSHAEIISGVTKHYLDHRFDLLGSGWVQVKHGMRCRGLEDYRYDMGSPIEADSEGKWLGGRINSANLRESQRIWKLIANRSSKLKVQSSKFKTDYTPIDWHLDFKSGYRWSESTWYKDIKYGHKLGVDIKMPWELARMQHLPQMALFFTSFPAGSDDRKFLFREFRNQILDFIATNPPRFGVNWFCTMDVAIRAANWLLAYDIFSYYGARFDDSFEKVFARSIYEHGQHIISNLEWQDLQRGNHYLADIAGLACIAAYLPTTETDAWLAFAIHELITEVDHQFYADGSNFEASTAYHRLSAEMIYFATALILGLPRKRFEKLKRYDPKALKTGRGKPKLMPAPLPFCILPEGSSSVRTESPFPAWYFERMERMSEFIMDITKPNGHISQIGDNDSGRFFKLGPIYKRMTVKQAKEKYTNLEGYSELPDDADYFMEDHLDCSELVASAYALFGREDFAAWLGGEDKASDMPACCVMRYLAVGVTIASQRFSQRQREINGFYTIGTEEDFNQTLSEMDSKSNDFVSITEYPSYNGELCQEITLRAYPDFGLYLYTSPRIYLAIRCWPGRRPFQTGHMHNDQLSIELVIEGREVILDPGTYLYTPCPDLRNRYRSVSAHFTPWPFQEEPVPLDNRVFHMANPKPGHLLYFGREGIWGTVSHNGKPIDLLCIIDCKGVKVYHRTSDAISSQHRTQSMTVTYSPGYGIALKENPIPHS